MRRTEAEKATLHDMQVGMIKGIVREEFLRLKKEYTRNLKAEIYDFIDKVGREIIIEELKKVDVAQVLSGRFDRLLQEQFTPVLNNALKLAIKHVGKRIDKQLRQVIELKTSTISEVRHEIREFTASSEKDALKLLEEEFPEYYEAIAHKQKQLEKR